MSKDEKRVAESVYHIAIATAATFLTQPLRVCLNQASKCRSPLATINAARPYLLKGLSFNLLRGALATGSQSYAKHMVQADAGLVGGIIAASLCGSFVASCIETPFIRKPIISQKADYSLWRFSRSLSMLYFYRELGFSLAVLAKNDFSPITQYGILFGATWTSAIFHKLACFEAVRDCSISDKTIPDFKNGIFYTIRAISYGWYTHPAFEVPYKDPKTMQSLITNFLQASCGFNMYFFRLSYLFAFGQAFHFATTLESSLVPVTKSYYTKFFNEPKRLSPIETNAKNSSLTKSS